MNEDRVASLEESVYDVPIPALRVAAALADEAAIWMTRADVADDEVEEKRGRAEESVVVRGRRRRVETADGVREDIVADFGVVFFLVWECEG